MKKISQVLSKNITAIKEATGENMDIVYKEFKIVNLNACVVFVLGLCDTDKLSEHVLFPLFRVKELSKKDNVNYLIQNAIYEADTKTEKEFANAIEELLKGKAILFIDEEKECIVLATDRMKERSPEEPPTSATLKGPRIGFVENIKTNLGLVRKILATPDFKSQTVKVGKYTNTQVTVIYVSTIADPKIVNEIIEKIKGINIDGIIDSYYITDFLEKRKLSFFKQIGNTEKPDIFCAKLLEGRVGILVDGSPIALTIPFLLLEDFQSSNDYYSQHLHVTFIRFIRLASFFITAMIPGMYVAIQLYHYKIIPLNFLITMLNTTHALPLTPFAETLFVLVLFEILYEASLRMPRYLGLALSIVGALILGDTAVQAGLISPPAVMIVALSGITLYTIPDQASQLSILRLAYMLAGGFLGLFGIIILTLFFIFYLNDFDSYGSAYLAPLSPYSKKDMKDSFVKIDLTRNQERPESIKNINKTRMKNE